MMRFKQFLAKKTSSGLTSDHHELAMAEAIRQHSNVKDITSYTSDKVKTLKSHPQFDSLVSKYRNHVGHILSGLGISSPITAIHWHDRPEHISKTFSDAPEHTRPADISLTTEDGKHTHIDFKKSKGYSMRTAGEKTLTDLGIEVNRQHMPTNAKKFFTLLSNPPKNFNKENFLREIINGQKQGTNSKHQTYKVVVSKNSEELPLVMRNDHFADSLLTDKRHKPELHHKEGSNSVNVFGLSFNFKPRSKKFSDSQLNIAIRKRRLPFFKFRKKK